MITFLAISGVLFWVLLLIAVWAVAVGVARGIKQVRAERANVDARIAAVARIGTADIDHFLKGGGEQ